MGSMSMQKFKKNFFCLLEKKDFLPHNLGRNFQKL